MGIWDLAGCEPATSVLRLKPFIWDAAFSPDGRLVVLLGPNEGGMLLDLLTGQELPDRIPGLGSARCAQFAPDGHLLALGRSDGTITLSEIQPSALPRTSFQQAAAVNDVEFSSDGRQLVSASADATACVWDLASGLLVTRLQHQGPVSHASFTPEGHHIVTVTRAAPVLGQWAWNVRKSISSRPGCYAEATQLQTWDARSGTKVGGPILVSNFVNFLTLSPERRRALISTEYVRGNQDYSRIIDLTTGQKTGPVFRHAPGPSGQVFYACFSPDGAHILTTGNDETAKLWDAETGALLCPPLVHRHHIFHVSFSPDGRLIVTASLDGSVRIWDASSGEPVSPPLRRHICAEAETCYDGPIRAFFAPDAGHVLIAYADGELRVWSLPKPGPSPDKDMLLSELLSYHRVNDNGIVEPSEPATLERAWHSLRQGNKADFEPTATQIHAWENEFGKKPTMTRLD
jgi:WD40 repeat protein